MRKRLPSHQMRRAASTMPQCTTLSNGIRVVTDQVPFVRSVALGVWLDCGSRDDTLPGTAHVLEHVVFRRSRRYSGTERSRVVESLGAYLNAATTKEQTYYYVRGLAEHFERLADVLVELAFAPAFTRADVEKERRIVAEEIRSYDDDPEEVVCDRLDELLFGSHPLARPIAGTLETLGEITPAVLADFHRQQYIGHRCVVVASGPLEHERVVEVVARLAERWNVPAGSTSAATDRPPRKRPPRRVRIERTFQQAHCAFGIRTDGARSKERHALALLNVLLGDSASSRLYRRVRERRALAYAVYSSLQLWSDCGELTVYAGIKTDRTDEAIAAIEDEIARLASVPPTAAEFSRARQQLRSSLLMSTESLSARMHAIAHMVLVEGQLQPLEAIVSAVEDVTLDEVRQVAHRYGKVEQWSQVLCQ
ncbi:MAG: insulinase family protein [Chlorobi bacterium]|nr:insulinase family protein [Chlorobiota bacterium]